MNINVIGGYLVITTDKYVKNKLKDDAMSFNDRKKLIDLCIENNEDLSWIKSSHKPDGSALSYMKSFKLDKLNILPINIMGADKILTGKNIGKWRKYTKSYKNRNCLTVCINRDEYSAYEMYLKDVKNGLCNTNAFQFLNIKIDNVSSTKVRNILNKYKNILNNINNDDQKMNLNDIKRAYKNELNGMIYDCCHEYLWDNIIL